MNLWLKAYKVAMAKLNLGKAQISGPQILLRTFVIVREYDYYDRQPHLMSPLLQEIFHNNS